MKRVDITNVQEAGEFKQMPAGPYVCIIRNVEDDEDKEYLRIHYDIAAGEYKGHFDELRANHPDWSTVGSYVRSYKPNALPFFKRFCSAVSKSNGNFVFDGGSVNCDEKSLIGKRIGINFQDEEYYSNSGDLRTRLIVYAEFPVDKLKDQKVPAVKMLKETKPKTATNTTGFMDVSKDSPEEVPFD